MKFTAPIISLFGPRWVINSLLVLSTRQFYPHDQRLRSLCLFKSPFLVRHPQQGGRLDHWKFGELDRPPREIATRGRHTMCRMHTALLAVKLLQLSRWVRNPFLIGSRKNGSSAGVSGAINRSFRAKTFWVASRASIPKRRGRANLCFYHCCNFDIFFL